VNSLFTTPLDEGIASLWARIPASYKKAFYWLVLIHLLAFGFEMTNLTLHHDDLVQIFIQDTILGHYLGRFGTGWLHYYTQGAYFMPFWQMSQAIVLMSLYGLVVAHLWGMRRILDAALIGAILVIFPYMAHVYQYNTTMATYTVAHLLAALAILLSIKARTWAVLLAAACHFFAFSIYQSVANNAAAIFLFWLLLQWVCPPSPDEAGQRPAPWRSTVATLIAVLVGGLLYVAAVKSMDISFGDYQGAGQAFDLGKGFDPVLALRAVFEGSRAFYLWPEHYFPSALKALQIVLLAGAAGLCLLQPRGWTHKIAAVGLLALAAISPRFLQMLHPHGHYHQLTLTAYAVVVAGATAVILRAPWIWSANGARVFSIILILGYLVQCNWISTVNLLNTQAHFHTLGQILARLRSLPPDAWDGQTVLVVGRYDMAREHPYKPATGVASRYMDAGHMDLMARLLREPIRFSSGDRHPQANAYALSHPAWPAAQSVGALDGHAIVVLSLPAEGQALDGSSEAPKGHAVERSQPLRHEVGED